MGMRSNPRTYYSMPFNSEEGVRDKLTTFPLSSYSDLAGKPGTELSFLALIPAYPHSGTSSSPLSPTSAPSA